MGVHSFLLMGNDDLLWNRAKIDLSISPSFEPKFGGISDFTASDEEVQIIVHVHEE